MKNIYGYFSAFEQTTPDRDPGLNVPCPICQKVIGSHTPDSPIKTISIFVEGDSRSYFYRVHKPCYDDLNPEQQNQLDWPIVDAIIKSNQAN